MSRAAEVMNRFEMLDVDRWNIDITDAMDRAQLAFRHDDTPMTAFAAGQMLSVMRTSVLYGVVAQLQDKSKERPVVVGTTNRDEGAYIGFFGKGSDASVDVQVISDLHKSEVRKLAELMRVPKSVIDAVPKGDVWDGRSDEQMMGFSYDELEYVQRCLELNIHPRGLLGERMTRMVVRREQNHHKYLAGGNQVQHLDVLPRGVLNGWQDLPFRKRQTRPQPHLPGQWQIGSVPDVRDMSAVAERIHLSHAPGAYAARVRGALKFTGVRALLGHLEGVLPAAASVGVNGTEGSPGVGSYRAPLWSEPLAEKLFEAIRIALPSTRFLGPDSFTDNVGMRTSLLAAMHNGFGQPHRSWRLVGLSPLLRFMRYENGGEHYTHFDAGYDYGAADGRRTLLSVVFYLTNVVTGEGGETRFIRTGEERLPSASRNHADWTRPTRDDEVVHAERPTMGNALIFDHRLAHDVGRYMGTEPRVIIRADVVYEAVPDGRE